jgi:hypothetical protein
VFIRPLVEVGWPYIDAVFIFFIAKVDIERYDSNVISADQGRGQITGTVCQNFNHFSLLAKRIDAADARYGQYTDAMTAMTSYELYYQKGFCTNRADICILFLNGIYLCGFFR